MIKETGQEVELAIIIVSYNSLADLPACLDSLRTATGKKSRTYVIDNCSTDGTLEKLPSRYPAVEWIASKENLGFGPANNKVFQQTSAPIVLFLNPDTVLPAGSIDELCKALDGLPDAGCVGPRLLNVDGSFQRGAGGRSLSLKGAFLEFFPLFRNSYGFLLSEEVTQTCAVDWIAGTCLLVRREAFEAVSGFDPRYFLYYEDMDLGARLREAGHEAYYVPAVAITHARGRSIESLDPAARRRARDSIRRFLRQHHGRLWCLAFRLIVLAGCLVRLAAHSLKALIGRADRGAIRRLWHMAGLYM